MYKNKSSGDIYFVSSKFLTYFFDLQPVFVFKTLKNLLKSKELFVKLLKIVLHNLLIYAYFYQILAS